MHVRESVISYEIRAPASIWATQVFLARVYVVWSSVLVYTQRTKGTKAEPVCDHRQM